MTVYALRGVQAHDAVKTRIRASGIPYNCGDIILGRSDSSSSKTALLSARHRWRQIYAQVLMAFENNSCFEEGQTFCDGIDEMFMS